MDLIDPKNFRSDSGRTGCPRKFKLARAKIGDLESDEIAVIREHVAKCEKCRAVWDSMEVQKGESQGEDHIDSKIANIDYEARKRLKRRKRLMTRLVLTSILGAILLIMAFALVMCPD